jgi:hypothetical protein
MKEVPLKYAVEYGVDIVVVSSVNIVNESTLDGEVSCSSLFILLHKKSP